MRTTDLKHDGSHATAHTDTHARAHPHTRTRTRTHAHAPRGREKALGALLGLTYNTLNQHAFRCALLQRQRRAAAAAALAVRSACYGRL